MSAVVHIVDDDPSFRTAVGRVLAASGYHVEGYASAEALLERLPDGRSPCCILLDVRIPGLSGPELQQRLAGLGLLLPIVFLTGHGDIPTSVQAIKAGAEDFLTKPVRKEQLLDAIQRAVSRHEAQSERNEQLGVLRSRVASLTRREREVFALVVRGRINKQIAHELGTTERTIKAHRHKVMEKVSVRSVAELVTVAERIGATSGLSNEPKSAHPQGIRRRQE